METPGIKKIRLSVIVARLLQPVVINREHTNFAGKILEKWKK